MTAPLEKTALAPDDLRRLKDAFWMWKQQARYHPKTVQWETRGRALAQDIVDTLRGGKAFHEASTQVARAADRFQKALDEANIREISRQVNRTLRLLRNAGTGTILGLGALAGYRQFKKIQREKRQNKYWRKAIQELEKTSSLHDDLLEDPNIRMHLLFRNLLKKRKRGGEPKMSLKKEAALTPEQKRKALEVLKNVLRYSGQALIPAVGGAVISEVASGTSNLTKKLLKRADKAWEKFVQRFPEYRGDRKAREYFDVLYDFNPAAARHPVVVRAYLEGLYQYEFFNPQLLETMTKVEGGYRRSREADRDFRAGITDALRKVTDIAMADFKKMRDELRKDVETELMQKQRHRTDAERRLLRNQLLLSEIKAEEALNRLAGSKLTPKERAEIARDAILGAASVFGSDPNLQEKLIRAVAGKEANIDDIMKMFWETNELSGVIYDEIKKREEREKKQK